METHRNVHRHQYKHWNCGKLLKISNIRNVSLISRLALLSHQAHVRRQVLAKKNNYIDKMVVFFVGNKIMKYQSVTIYLFYCLLTTHLYHLRTAYANIMHGVISYPWILLYATVTFSIIWVVLVFKNTIKQFEITVKIHVRNSTKISFKKLYDFFYFTR